MRAVVSYAAGILTLVMMLASGSAWSLTEDPGLVPAHIHPSHARLAFAGDLAPPPEPEPDSLPPGCRPPLVGATCAVTVPVGGLDLPETVYDLVPGEIDSVEDWRPIVERFFAPHHVPRAMRIIACESGGRADAKNPRSTASGLFQHLASLWPERSAKAGWAGADPFDPVANVAVAAWLVYDFGGWSHWNPSSSCWR
ncbi:MAG: hypothetical protein R3246_12850 [Acidimicrobiia bacterium]|nr:hypothetical protein [Acidimicrobiia bacterium]